MEKISTFDRVVGHVSEAEKKSILKEAGERFANQSFEELEGLEREKTPDELHILSFVDDATNEIRRRYGLADFHIPEANFHVILADRWPKHKTTSFVPMLQGGIIKERDGKMPFAKKIFHEMLHMKSYGALQATAETPSEIIDYRCGLTVKTRDGEHVRLVNLNEAVTEELTRRFVMEQFDDPFFSEEARRTWETAQRFRNQRAHDGSLMFGDSTYFADVHEERSPVLDEFGNETGIYDVRKTYESENFTKERERAILDTLIRKLFERNPDRFEDPDAVFDLFARGMMTGDLMSLGRLIDRTFGEGALRKIGKLDSDIDEQERFVQSL